MSAINSTSNRSLGDFVVLVKTKKDDSESGLVGVAYFREETRKEYEEYIGKLKQAAVQADIEAAKNDRPVKLTDQQITSLAEKYNPRNMTEKEYNAFIHEMIDMGVVTREDARYITDWEGGGCYELFSPGSVYIGGRTMIVKYAPYFYRGCKCPMTYNKSNGDILTMYGFQSAMRSYDPDTGKEYLGRTERTYNKIYTVLKQMENINPECVQARQDAYHKKYQTGRIAWDLRNRSC